MKRVLTLFSEIKANISEILVNIIKQHFDDFHESRTTRRSMLPTSSHEFIKLIGAIFWSFHNTTVDYISQYLIIRKTLEEIRDKTLDDRKLVSVSVVLPDMVVMQALPSPIGQRHN